MTVERFQDMYRFLVEQRINDFGNTCEHPHFDKLLAVMNSPLGEITRLEKSLAYLEKLQLPKPRKNL